MLLVTTIVHSARHQPYLSDLEHFKGFRIVSRPNINNVTTNFPFRSYMPVELRHLFQQVEEEKKLKT